MHPRPTAAITLKSVRTSVWLTRTLGHVAVILLGGGGGLVLLGLGQPWATDGPRPGSVSGEWLELDGRRRRLLAALAVAAVLLVLSLLIGRPVHSPRQGVVGGLLAALAICGVAYVWFLTDFAIVMADLRTYTAGKGLIATVVGLVLVLVGSVVAFVAVSRALPRGTEPRVGAGV